MWRAALCADWRKHMSAGEQAVLLRGADRRQAMILRRMDNCIEFRNGSVLEIATNDARLIRGRSAIAVLGSEACHWRVDENSTSVGPHVQVSPR